MILERSFQIYIPLRAVPAAPAVSFVRHRNYGYVSSQELTAGTHQNDSHYGKDI